MAAAIEKREHDIGEGLYALAELSRYVAYDRGRADPARVARWLSRGLNPVAHRPRRPDYSFHDLISLFVVRELVGAGVKLPAIRTAERHLRDRLELARPFASVRLKTDGVNVLYHAAPEVLDQLTAANLAGQEVLEPTIAAALRDVAYEHSVAVRWRPEPTVELDPEIQLGEPCVAGTRIPTAQIVALLARDEEADAVAQMYGIAPAAVRDARRFERRLAEAS
jgi:uncharacterized protein (DUF433 family)